MGDCGGFEIMENLFLMLIWFIGINAVLAIAAFVADVLLPMILNDDWLR